MDRRCRVWEKARLREIPAELEAAVKSENADACRSLAKELSSKVWRIQPSPDFVSQAVAASEKLEHGRQSAELSEIAKAMSDAFCAGDEVACREQRDHWLAIVSSMKTPPPMDIMNVAEPALVWLEDRDAAVIEEESRLQSIADLESAINAGESVLALQKAYSSATRFSEPIDPQLESRYRNVLAELQLRAKRRTIMRVAGVLAVALSGLIAFGVWQWRSMQEREVKASVTALNQLLSENKLAEAEQYVASLKSSKAYVLSSAEVSAIQSDLTGRLKQEAERVANFNSYIEQADNEKPELIDLDALVNAEKIASTEPEKAMTFRIRQKRESYDRQVESQQFQELKVEVARLTKEVDALEARELADLPDALLERTFKSLMTCEGSSPNRDPVAQH